MITLPGTGPLTPQITGAATRREFLAGSAALALLLSACSSSGGGDEASGTATADIETDFGTVQVPVTPQRVAVTYTDSLDMAVALELSLVGGTGARGNPANPFPPFLPAERLRGVERLDTYPELDMESIAAVRPDLILNTYPDQKTHEDLTRVAPTITLAPTTAQTWQDIATRIAAALDLRTLAERVVQERTDRATQVREAIAGGQFEGATFAAGYASSEGFYLYGQDIPPCPMLTELGLQNIASAPAAGATESVQQLSLERLSDLAGADVLIVTSDPPEGGYEPDLSLQAAVRDSPLWQALPAVQSGSIVDYPVDLVFPGPYCDQAALELIDRALGQA